jgi:type IV fimbrial biogenesis protein FimT
MPMTMHTLRRPIGGFTLIEMLMVLVIVGIMTAIALPSMRTHLANADIRGVAEEMRSGLEVARTEAIRRNTAVNFVRNGVGWTVVVPGAGAGGTDLTVATRAPRQARVVVTADVDTIAYSGSGWTTPFGSSMNISLQSPSIGQCRPAGGINCLNVLAAGGGLVRSCDPAAVAGSTTAC